MRKEIKLLATRLNNKGKRVYVISLANLFFEAIKNEGGKEQIIKEEKEFGFLKAQESLNTVLSDPDYSPIPDLLERKLRELNPAKDIVFLVRAGVFAPNSYRISALLDEMKGKTLVPTVLFYPGKMQGITSLKYMGMPSKGAGGSYHVNIYNR